MVLANEIARTLLTVDHQAAAGEVIVGQTLVVGGGPSALEDRERGTRKPTYVDQACGAAGRVVVCEFDVRELFISVTLERVDDHSQHLDHCGVSHGPPTVAVWVVGAGGDFSGPREACRRRAKALSKSGDRRPRVCRGGVFPEGNVPFDLIIFTLSSAVNSAAATTNMQARRLKRPQKSKMQVLPRGVAGRGPK